MKKIARIIVFAVCVAIGIGFLVVGVMQYRLQRELTADPQTVTATIIESRVSSDTSMDTNRDPLRSNSTTSHTPEVKFRYVIDSQAYESDLLRPSEIVRGYASAAGARQELAPFPVGAQVLAYYTPGRPDRAYLVPEQSAGPVVFMILGLVVPVAGYLVARYLI